MLNEIAQAYKDLADAQSQNDDVAATEAYARLGELIQTAATMPQELATIPAVPEFPDDPDTPQSIRAQREEIMTALYEAATSGNVPAALKWLDLHANIPDEPEEPVIEVAPEPGKKRRRTRKPKRPKKPREQKITVKEEKFLDFYFGESAYNGTDAARKAGYKGSDNVLAVTAHTILRKPKIVALIRARLDQIAMPLEQVFRILGEQARGSAEFFLELDPTLPPNLSLKKAQTEGKLHLIKNISFHDNGTVKSIGWYSTLEAAKTIGNLHRLVSPRKPTAEVGDTPEETARNYESGRADARSAVDRLMQKFKLSESEAAKRAVKFFPAAREWIAAGEQEPTPSPAVN